MESALLVALALGVVSLGIGVTVLLATRVSTRTLVRAQEHGRFAGLGSAERSAGVGRALPSAKPSTELHFQRA